MFEQEWTESRIEITPPEELTPDPQPIFCWACGRLVPRTNRTTFYTQEGKRAYVHAVRPGIPFVKGALLTKPSECYTQASQRTWLYTEDPQEAAEAEKRKGILY
jgi:hypothetical protein